MVIEDLLILYVLFVLLIVAASAANWIVKKGFGFIMGIEFGSQFIVGDAFWNMVVDAPRELGECYSAFTFLDVDWLIEDVSPEGWVVPNLFECDGTMSAEGSAEVSERLSDALKGFPIQNTVIEDAGSDRPLCVMVVDFLAESDEEARRVAEGISEAAMVAAYGRRGVLSIFERSDRTPSAGIIQGTPPVMMPYRHP